jgi:hypothetical protein
MQENARSFELQAAIKASASLLHLQQTLSKASCLAHRPCTRSALPPPCLLSSATRTPRSWGSGGAVGPLLAD